MYKQQAKSSHNGTMPMDHARRSSSDSDHRNAPPGRLYKSGGAGKPVARKNFFRTTGSMYKSKSGFDLYIDPVARKNFFPGHRIYV